MNNGYFKVGKLNCGSGELLKYSCSCGTVTVVPGLVELPGLYLEVTDNGIRVPAATARLFTTLWEL